MGYDDIIEAMERAHQCNYSVQHTTSARVEPRRITDRPYIAKITFVDGFLHNRPDYGWMIDISVVDPDGTAETELGEMVVVKNRRNFSISTGPGISALDYADKLEDLAIRIREAVMEMI